MSQQCIALLQSHLCLGGGDNFLTGNGGGTGSRGIQPLLFRMGNMACDHMCSLKQWAVLTSSLMTVPMNAVLSGWVCFPKSSQVTVTS